MYDYTDKQRNVKDFIKLMYNKTLSMFEYKNLPESLPAVELERMLQTNGYLVVTKYKGEPTAFKAGLSGEDQDVYGRPTLAVISNPLYSATVKLDKDAVLIKSDDNQHGLQWLFEKYGTIINETDISIVVANYNKRMQTLISASDDNTVESAKAYLKEVEDGKLGVIADSKLFNSLQASPTTTSASNNTSDLVELQQYLKATLFNEIGLNANYNMKRERLTDDEVQANTDNLRPFADNMLENRQDGIEKVNAMFGTNISVDFGSIWKVKADDFINATDNSDDSGEDSTADITGMVRDIYDYITKPDSDEREDNASQKEDVNDEPDKKGDEDDETK